MFNITNLKKKKKKKKKNNNNKRVEFSASLSNFASSSNK